MKGLLAFLAVAAAAVVVAAPVSASSDVTVTIRHQKVGCHSWAIGNGAYRPTQTLTVKAGTTLTFIDNDVMPQLLVRLAGPSITLVAPNMHTMGAQAKVTLSRPGTYVFGTRPGEDYTKGVVTVGEDNVLRLVVTVK